MVQEDSMCHMPFNNNDNPNNNPSSGAAAAASAAAASASTSSSSSSSQPHQVIISHQPSHPPPPPPPPPLLHSSHPMPLHVPTAHQLASSSVSHPHLNFHHPYSTHLHHLTPTSQNSAAEIYYIMPNNCS